MRHLALLLTGTVALLAAAMTFKWGCEHRAAPRTSGIGGALKAAPVDLLFIGSSHTRQSYDVRELEEQTGRSAFLVAYNGLDFGLAATVLPEFLADSRKRPKVLIIEGYVMSLVRPEGLQDSRLFFDAPPDLKGRLMGRIFAEEKGLGRYMDAFDLLANRNNELLLTYAVQSRIIDDLSYNGGYVGKEAPGLRSFKDIALLEEPGVAAPGELLALKKMIRDAREAGVTVLCLGSPMPGPVERQPATRALKTQLKALLAEQRVPHFDGAVGFPIDNAPLFVDSNHLSTAGRALYTRASATFINRLLGGRPQAVAKNP